MYSNFLESGKEGDLIKYLFKVNNINCFNLDIKYKEEYSFGHFDGHLNINGHKVIGETLYDKLISNSIIPNKFIDKPIINKHIELDDNSDNNYNLNDELKIKINGYKKSAFCETNVLYIINDSIKNNYINKINELLKPYNNEIKIFIEKINSTHTLSDYITKINNYILKHNSGIVIVDLPEKLILNEKDIILLDKYCEFINKEVKIKVIFFNKKKNYNTDLLTAIFDSKGLNYFNSNANFSKWLIKTKGENYIEVLEEYLNTNDLINKVESLTNPECYNINLSLNKKVYASSSLEKWGWHKMNLVDGQRITWKNSRGWVCKEIKNYKKFSEWVLIDLDTIHDINKIVIYPRNDFDNKTQAFPNSFKIITSKDSIFWNNATVKKNFTLIKKGEVLIFDYPSMKARYIKFEGNSFSNKSEKEMAISGIEVFGKNAN